MTFTASHEKFDKLKNFLETKPASLKSIAHLRKGVEIGIVIGHQMECACFNLNGTPTLEKRKAQKPDVIFLLKPESVDILCSQPGDDVGEFGIAVLKEYLSGGVRIQAPGSVFNLMRNGYLSIIKEGGVTFTKFLALHGASNITKILTMVKNLKNG